MKEFISLMGNTLSKKIEDWIAGIIATALAGIAMGIFMKITWKGWDKLVRWIMMTFGVGCEIEYARGIILFILACMLGLIQLKKFKKRLNLSLLCLRYLPDLSLPALLPSILMQTSCLQIQGFLSKFSFYKGNRLYKEFFICEFRYAFLD